MKRTGAPSSNHTTLMHTSHSHACTQVYDDDDHSLDLLALMYAQCVCVCVCVFVHAHARTYVLIITTCLRYGTTPLLDMRLCVHARAHMY